MQLITPVPLGSSSWLLRLRSFAAIGQLLSILIARFITPVSFPVVPLLVLIAVTATTNFFYGWWLARVASSNEQKEAGDRDEPLQVAFCLMALDLVTLTFMLFFVGGADNPFCFFYFVNLAVGGVMLHRAATWTLTGLAIVGYWMLLLVSWPVRGLSVETTEPLIWNFGGFGLRDWASLIAFSACVSVITYFVTRTSRLLRDRDEELRRSEAQRADAMRLEGLTTLAAGAAHELATPLSAIDVACRELTHHLDGVDKPESINDDLQLIDGQLMMCRMILSRMRSAAGDAVADQWNQTTLGELIDTTLEGIRDPHRVEILEPAVGWPTGEWPTSRWPSSPSDPSNPSNPSEDESDMEPWERQPMWLPQEAVAQSIRNLIHNGLDASPPREMVTVQPVHHGDRVALIVVDHGHGMSTDVIDRAGDPFFTTKEPGRGIGLGLFLTRNVITRLGGELTFKSTPDQGTTATVVLPLAEPPTLKHRGR